MDTLTLYSTVALAPVAAYALSPATSALSVVVLIALVWAHIKHALQVSDTPSARILTAILLPLASLSVGTILSLLLSNPYAGTTLHTAWDALLALSLFALSTSLCPLLALALTARRHSGSYTALLLPPLFFALAGIAQERAGTGRVGWWVPPLLAPEGVGWITRISGQVGADALVCVAGIALAEAAWAVVGGREGGGLLGGMEVEIVQERRRRAHQSLRLLAVVLAVVLVGPLVPASRYTPEHPVPGDSAWTYPPLKVACVVPPALVSGRDERRTTVDDWLAETRVVAGRGAKVLTWSEGAVRLDKGQRGEEGNRWEAMGEEERELLKRVGEVCDMYKVYILATYLVPPASSSSHERQKYLNVATLVGPASLSSTPSAPSPHLVWSTTKHHPVPFVESYTHATRALPALGSAPHALPFASVQLPHAPHTPSPHRTPLQRVALAGAICQDVAFPSLLSTFSPVPHTGAHNTPLRTPQLLLNPSLAPPSLPGLAHASLAQARSRALEHGAFLLRCDATGSSLLAGPDGDVRVLVLAREGAGSWEAELPLGRAAAGRGGTAWDALGGTRGGDAWVGAQGWAWLALVAFVALVRVVEGGEAGHWLRGVEWRQLGERAREVGAQAGRRVASVFVRESEEGMNRQGMVTEGRLVDVE
ncbi:hypothetical protein JCM10450v2_006393 [Rhodotorula kratochvilovae]